MSAYIKFQDKPGVFADDTALTASVYYIDANQIRFERGKWEIRGGWEKVSTDQFEGVCRGLHVWRNSSQQPLVAIGTHLAAYACFDSDLYTITPVVEIGSLTNPFTTTNASAVVVVTDVAHGRTEGSKVRFSNATAVGGITIDGTYEVTEVLTVDTYSITHSSAATSGATGGGTVDYDYFLSIGLEDNLGGAGWGVGAYGEGGFESGADTNELYPRTWCLDNWGSNLLGNPRGQGLYEWAPAYAAPELVTNGTFAVDANWTKGTGWTISGGAAVATVSAASLLEQQLELEPAAYFELEFDVTRAAGTVTPQIGTTAIGDAISATGRYRRTFFTGSGTLNFSKDNAFSGTIDNVSVRQRLEMTIVPNAPTEITCMAVTPEDMVMVGGCIDEQTGLFDPLLVRWCARRNNQLWTPGFQDGNTSGFYRLAIGSRIVRIMAGRGEMLIYTDECLYVARFNPDPNINYSFTPMGRGSGLIGPNAVAVGRGGVARWFGTSGEFMQYAGGMPESIPNTLRRTFIENLSRSQFDKIYASGLDATNEFQILYPDQRDGNECSRYLKFNYAEPAWDPGLFERSAWTDLRALGYPLAAGLDGYLYYQEKGTSADGAPMAWHIESGAFSLRDGKIASVMGLRPDFKDLLGGAELTVRCWLPDVDDVQEFGPYAITSATKKVDLRTQGSMIAFRLEGNSAPAGGRSGTFQIDVRDTRCGR